MGNRHSKPAAATAINTMTDAELRAAIQATTWPKSIKYRDELTRREEAAISRMTDELHAAIAEGSWPDTNKYHDELQRREDAAKEERRLAIIQRDKDLPMFYVSCILTTNAWGKLSKAGGK